MKKTTKIIKILLIVMLITLNFLNVVKVYASQPIVPDVNYYKPIEEDTPEEVLDVAGTVVVILQVLGTAIAVITLMFIGIKYMTAGVEEKASYKKSMIPYLIGCLLLFTTVTIINAMYHLLDPINNSL